MGSNGTMMVHGVGAGAQGNISSTDAHSSSWLQQPLLPPPPPPSSSLPFQYNPNQYPPVGGIRDDSHLIPTLQSLDHPLGPFLSFNIKYLSDSSHWSLVWFS